MVEPMKDEQRVEYRPVGGVPEPGARRQYTRAQREQIARATMGPGVETRIVPARKRQSPPASLVRAQVIAAALRARMEQNL